VRTFAPSWIPGATIVALLDYKHWAKFEDPAQRRLFSVQKEFIESYPDHFEKVMESRVSSVCAFRYLKPLDFGALPFGRMQAERGPPQGLRAALSQTLQKAFGIGR
jgi:hypothetical protein